jgi:hypothetical protein
MNQSAADSRPRFTAKQGQYLAFIHAYKRLLGRSPAEAEMQRSSKSPRLPSIRWCYRSKRPASSHESQPPHAPSLSASIRPIFQS